MSAGGGLVVSVGGVVVGGFVVGGVVVGVVGQPIAIKLMTNNNANGINSNFLFTIFNLLLSFGTIKSHISYPSSSLGYCSRSPYSEISMLGYSYTS